LADTQSTRKLVLQGVDSASLTGGRSERTLLCIAAVFVGLGAVTLYLGAPGFGAWHLILVLVPWVLSYGAAHLILDRFLPDRDPVLLPVAALLTGVGLLLLGSLARNFLLRQAVWVPLCVAGLLAVVRVGHDLRWLRRFRYTWLVGGLALLATTLVLGVNPSGYGPRLWLGAFGLFFQPSELLKLLMIAYLASYLAERTGLIVSEGWRIGRWRGPPLAYVGPLFAMFGIALVILAWQQDLGAAMLFLLTFLAMLYLATGQWGYPASGLVFLAALGAAGYAYSDLVRLRIDSWWRPWPEASGRAFQVVQSLQAYGAGRLFGAGLGMGSPDFIPAVHTDFAHAGVAEELGLLGALAVVALYAALMLRGFRIASKERPGFGQLLAAGITTGLAVQSWVIIAGNVRVAPITGVTLPFVSYGGSSLLASSLALGLLLRISGSTADPSQEVVSPLTPADPAQARRRLIRLAAVLSVAMVVLAAACGYWAIVRSSFLSSRADNLRRVIYEQRIVRGSILDRHGTALADIAVAGDGLVTRRYPVPQAAPVLGYASLRYGTAGVEGALDDGLRGEKRLSPWEAWLQGLMHRPPQGVDVQLTIDAELQKLAQELLEDLEGAAVLVHATTGEVLVLASSPTFDPEMLEEDWSRLTEDPSAPLFNRATQGLYQPGNVFHTVVLAEGIVGGLVDMASSPPNLGLPVSVDGVTVRCVTSLPADATLRDAYARGCPQPIVDAARMIGAEGLGAAVERWRLVAPLPLEIPSSSVDWAGVASGDQAVAAEALGQGALLLSPVRVALMVATLGADGEMPAAHLVKRVQDEEGRWQDAVVGEGQPIVSSTVAGLLLDAWSEHDGGRILWRAGTAFAGQERPPHTWFTALGFGADGVYALAILGEHLADESRASDAGIALLRSALAP
jgi:cell division protein FtsW (lipid II flippase)